jgi:hypothetical protein
MRKHGCPSIPLMQRSVSTNTAKCDGAFGRRGKGPLEKSLAVIIRTLLVSIFWHWWVKMISNLFLVEDFEHSGSLPNQQFHFTRRPNSIALSFDDRSLTTFIKIQILLDMLRWCRFNCILQHKAKSKISSTDTESNINTRLWDCATATIHHTSLAP